MKHAKSNQFNWRFYLSALPDFSPSLRTYRYRLSDSLSLSLARPPLLVSFCFSFWGLSSGVFYQFSAYGTGRWSAVENIDRRGGQHVVLFETAQGKRERRTHWRKKKGAEDFYIIIRTYTFRGRRRKEKKRTRNFLAFSLGRVLGSRRGQCDTHHKWKENHNNNHI